jgi:3'-phosphoadenosine 5'-phosphosulfate sulfotransferase (PAPS reductase)/FAD synthetase
MTYKAISLGWGVQSFTLAAMSALGILPKVDVAIHADTEHEMAGTYEFARQWTGWLEGHGVKVATVRNTKSGGTNVVARDSTATVPAVMIPAFTISAEGKRGKVHRQCTRAWKIDPVRRYLQAHRAKQPVDLWLGISTDEWHRAKDANVKYITHTHPLLDLDMSRNDCLQWLAEHDLPAPGKSSCTFCPLHNKAAWQAMKRAGGADWEDAIRVDASVRDVRLPGQMFVHSKCIPLVDAVPISEDYGYTQLAMLGSDDDDAECDSGFCFL